MAKVITKKIILEVSKLVREDHEGDVEVAVNVATDLETIAKELIGEGYIVEAFLEA